MEGTSLQPTPPTSPTGHHTELLAKLQEANRLLEADEKSLQSLSAKNSSSGQSGQSGQSSHSRKGSGSSIVSNTSGSSHVSNLACDDDNSAASESLWESWGKIVTDYDTVKKKPPFVKELVRKGLPHHFRSIIWQALCDVQGSPAKDLYVDYLRKQSPSEKVIKRDIARTFPDHDFFKDKNGLGQESLFNVMKAYSLHDREVGYCQGSGFIVGLLLMQMPEEEAFAVLVKLMQEYRLRELFKPSMAELGLCMFQLECLVQELLPELTSHFQTQGFYTSMYASTWFLTLFATALPLSIACRIMDLFISEGMEMIFRVGIAILQLGQEELLACDMEGMLKYFQKQVPVNYESDTDAEMLLTTAYQVKYNAKKMKKLEKEYTALKSKENEEQIELRRLRTENRLLRQRIDNLEKESVALADRLIQYQVTRAEEAEGVIVMRNELSTTRQQLWDVQHKLQDSDELIAKFKNGSSAAIAASIAVHEAQDAIQQLQNDLAHAHEMGEDMTSQLQEMQIRVAELEDANKQLRRAPSNDVQQLQEELIAARLREAEANLSLKELKQRVHELDVIWQRHVQNKNNNSSSRDSRSGKPDPKALMDEVLSVRLREAEALADLKQMKQRVMELETQHQISTNQIKRMGEDRDVLRQHIDDGVDTEKELRVTIKELERRIYDMDTKKKEESMMTRIREAEDAQLIEMLRQKIAHLEIQKEEVAAEGQLQNKESASSLQSELYQLQDEVLELRIHNQPVLPGGVIQTPVFPSVGIMTMSMYDDDIEDDLRTTDRLNQTLTEIIEGTSPKLSHKNDVSSPRSHGDNLRLEDSSLSRLKGDDSEMVGLKNDESQIKGDNSGLQSKGDNSGTQSNGDVFHSKGDNDSRLMGDNSSGESIGGIRPLCDKSDASLVQRPCDTSQIVVTNGPCDDTVEV